MSISWGGRVSGSLRQVRLEYAEIDRGETPIGEVTLRRYDTDDGRFGYEIRLGGNFLMATHGHHSESAMARLAWEMLDRRDGLSVLVGGLGAGYTLRAALDLPGVAAVAVVEIAPKVVEWNQRYFTETNGHALADPRTRVVIDDLRRHLALHRNAYDMVLLDVDNGPGWLAAEGNEELYTTEGIRMSVDALRTGGALAVWSPASNDVFWERFRAIVAEPKQEATDEIGRAANEPGDVVYLGRRS